MAEDLFPSPKKEKKGAPQELPTPVLTEINRISSRVRMLEDTIHNLRTRIHLTDQNLLSSNKEQNAELKTLGSDINKLKQKVMELNNQIKLLKVEFKSFAKKEDILTMKKYMDLWEPLNFMTRNEAEKLIKELIKEQNTAKIGKK